jgi:hypothetical protein
MERSRGFTPNAVAVMLVIVALTFFSAGYALHTINVAAAAATPTPTPPRDGDPVGLRITGTVVAEGAPSNKGASACDKAGGTCKIFIDFWGYGDPKPVFPPPNCKANWHPCHTISMPQHLDVEVTTQDRKTLKKTLHENKHMYISASLSHSN